MQLHAVQQQPNYCSRLLQPRTKPSSVPTAFPRPAANHCLHSLSRALFPPSPAISALPAFPCSSRRTFITTSAAMQAANNGASRDATEGWSYSNPGPNGSNQDPAGVPDTASTATVLAPNKRASSQDLTADAMTGMLVSPSMPRMGSPSSSAAAATMGRVAGYSPELSKALKSVVKIFTTMASPNFAQPWQMCSQTKCTATGFVIDPLGARRILTNAHAVANQVQVKVRKHGSAQKYNARVLAVGHECDIAMLTVDDDDFWVDVVPLEINGLPAMQEAVMVVGFPTGGDNVCVTKGVVSRIDRSQYSHGRTSLLAIQVDAAINSGNSGGPVLLGDHVVGIAFQCLTSGENIGYIIPVPVINHFLQDLERHGGKYTGFCEMGVGWQTLENTAMKAALGMPKGMTGVYVTKTEPMFHAAQVLQTGDVITHFNGVEIADDGTFLFREAVRIDFRHLVSQAFRGDMTDVRVWRAGTHLDLQVRLSTPKQLVPVHSHDIKPNYYIYAGLVFTPLTTWYLKAVYGADWSCKAPIKLAERAFAGSMKAEGQQVVILSKVLASDINAGYQDIGNIQVLRCNGTEVTSLAHLAHLLEGCSDPFVRLELEWNKVLILDNAKAKQQCSSLLQSNCIPLAYDAATAEALQQLAAAEATAPPPAASASEEEEVEAIAAEVRQAELN